MAPEQPANPLTAISVTVTPLAFEHLALLVSLERQAQGGTTASQMQAALECQNTCVLGVWQGEQLKGYALVARLPFEAELQAIGVLPACRRGGIGGALMEAVLALSRGWSSERLLLEVRASNHSAIRLYHRFGFSEDGYRPGYYPAAVGATGREDAMLMSRVL